MRDRSLEARLQVAAALSLLESSRLVQWSENVMKFIAVPREIFEAKWRNEMHPVFGRLLCWIAFSAGAELLAKGVCLARGVEIRKPIKVPVYPQGALDVWAKRFTANPNSEGTVVVPNFGTLGGLVYNKSGPQRPAALKELCSIAKSTKKEEQLLLATYTLLAKSIRNRDAHAYIPNVRDQHFSLVSALFTDVFNLLASWLDGGSKTLNDWRNEAQEIIDMD